MNTTEKSPALTLRPFTVAIPQSELDDLRSRLAATRFAAEPAPRPTPPTGPTALRSPTSARWSPTGGTASTGAPRRRR